MKTPTAAFSDSPDISHIIKHIFGVEATVTELLREFPRLRRAALAGEKVIIKSREGDLQLTRDTAKPMSLVGTMAGLLTHSENDMDRPTTEDGDWNASLTVRSSMESPTGVVPSHTDVPKLLDLWPVAGRRTSGRSSGLGEHGRWYEPELCKTCSG